LRLFSGAVSCCLLYLLLRKLRKRMPLPSGLGIVTEKKLCEIMIFGSNGKISDLKFIMRD